MRDPCCPHDIKISKSPDYDYQGLFKKNKNRKKIEKQVNNTFDAGLKKIFMTPKKPTSKTVFEKLIQPLSGLIQQCACKRECKKLPDHQWIETGLLRILSNEHSGRAFLQKLFDSGATVIKRKKSLVGQAMCL
jgi:hypothetical protein